MMCRLNKCTLNKVRDHLRFFALYDVSNTFDMFPDYSRQVFKYFLDILETELCNL